MDTAALLQNAPNNRRKPVKKENFLLAIGRLDGSRSMGIYGLAIASLFLGVMAYFMFSNPPVDTIPFLGVVAGLVFCIGVIVFVLARRTNLPVREQRRYYELGNVKPLSAKQRQALRLELVENYYHGFWNQTLEYYPCKVRVDNPRFKPITFSVADKQVYRSSLNDDWGIVSKAQYVSTVNDLFGGMHAKLFAVDLDYVLHIDDYTSRNMPADEKENLKKRNDNFLNRLAGLINKPTAYVTSCFEQQGTKPKPLIWGFDLWRVIPMARNAYMAGYISEEEAWKDLLRAADLVYYLFDSFEAFYDNYRLGNAYWSNDLETTSRRLQMWELYQARCNWPERNLPWRNEGTPDVPEEMRTGFAAYIKNKNKKYTEPIGFRTNGDHV